jgi:hypothetical protein
MPALQTEPRLADGDLLYAELIQAHRDLTPAQSERLNARLILLLMNHIGDAEVVRAAIRVAAAGQSAPAAPGR